MIIDGGIVKIEGKNELANYVVEQLPDGIKTITVFRTKYDDLVRKTENLQGLAVMHAKKIAGTDIDGFHSIR